MIKKVIILLLIFQMIFIPTSMAFSLDSIIESGDKFIDEGKESGQDIIQQAELQTTVEQIYNILFAIGVSLSVLIGAILGIKYMIGTVEEQAKIKETLIPYAISCIVIFGAFGIWKIIITIGGNIFN